MAYTRSRTKLPKVSVPRIIGAEADIRDGVRALRRKCAIMRAVHDVTGDPPLRRRPAGFEGLARIIVGQQLSVASAGAIWGRTIEACRPFEPHILLGLEDMQLAGVGLSRPRSARCGQSPVRVPTASIWRGSTARRRTRSTPR